jgi:hypothetical protein
MSTNFICFSSTGLIRCLKGGKTYLNTLLLCLLKDATGLVSNFDATVPGWTEATFPGYARQALNFGDPATNANPPDADMTDSLHTFTASAAVTPNQSIPGWAAIDPADGKWIFASLSNRSPAALMAVAGDEYLITPRFTGATLGAYP